MTTPPEAKLYHIRRDESATHQPAGGDGAGEAKGTGAKPAPAQGAMLLNDGPGDDGFGDLSLFPKAGEKTGPAAPEKPAPAGEEAPFDLKAAIAAVKAEKLPAGRLRIAEKVAALHKIEAASPEEALARLRQQGIDPFHKDALRRAVAEEGARSGAAPAPNLPTVVPDDKKLPAKAPAKPPPPAPRRGVPAPDGLSEAQRAEEILSIQRDIARRRRRRLWMLFARLAAFVFIPTLVTGWYFFTQATPLYATVSQFQIQHANTAAPSVGGLGALLGGSQLATNPESVAVQSYLTSRDAMLRLDRDMGFKRAFQDPSIDPLTRLAPDATNEAAFQTYKSSVKIGYDPTEGVINMEVVAPDPQLSREFSLALINYAEEQVDQMTARLRTDQLTEARKTYDEAEASVLDAQRRVQQLQEQMGILDPMAEGAVVMARIQTMEAELLQKRLELGTLQSNLRPNASRVDALKGEIARLEEMVAQTRLQLTESTEARTSLAAITGDLRMAEAELMTRQQMLASSLAMLEAARMEVNKQVRYLTLSVSPIAPDEATYPRAAQNTFVALLIFSGIYLMISLTVSILREQVSS